MGLLLKSALDWAAVWHRDQHRKYPPHRDTPDLETRVPYVSHIAGVAAILSRHGFRDEVVAAGALHDVIEDCAVDHAELTRRFGVTVADLVRHVSEQDKSLAWEDRKRLYLEHFSEKPWEAQAITLADKIDNLESLLVCARDYANPWPMFKRGRDAQVGRFRDLETRAAKLAPHPLIAEYVAVLRAVEALPA